MPEDQLDLTASYAAKTGRAFVRLVWTSGKEYHHLHVDLAPLALFGKHPPKTNSRVVTVRRHLAQFTGQQVSADIRAYLRVPVASLPPVGSIIFTGVRLKAKDTDIELTGAHFTFRQAEIDWLRWEIAKGSVSLEIGAKREEMVIDDTYLVAALEIIEEAMGRYVLGKE